MPDVEEETIEGQAAAVILDVAEIRKPDVIILGARAVMGVWSGLILGSTSMAVVQHANCPVLVIK